jgi:membrane-bound lytic murein transglycosylase B
MPRSRTIRESLSIAALQVLFLGSWPAVLAVPPPMPPTLSPPMSPPRPQLVNQATLPALPNDPAPLAAALNRVETALRSPATAAAELPALAHLQQRLYRRLGRSRSLASQVRPLLRPEHRRAYDHHIAARQALQALVPPGRPPLATVPAWRIIEPAPAPSLLASYRRAAAATGVPWQVLAAVNLVETGLGRLDGISVANAQGPMQFLPSTWAEPGIGRGSIRNPDDAIQAAARYLVRRGARQDLRRGLWGYNNSADYGTAVLRYAALLHEEPTAFAALYHWQIHLLTRAGDLWLPVGTQISRPTPAGDYLRQRPWSRSDAAP